MSEFTREQIIEAAKHCSKTDDIMVIFQKRFKELVGKSTQEEVAKKVNTSRQNVSNWLNGKSRPDIHTLAEISKGYHASADYLLGLTDIKKEEPAPSANDTSSKNNNSLSHFNDTSKSKICQELISQAQTDLLTIYDGMSEEECRAWELGELFKTLEFAKKAGEQK